jgi:aspartate aminotransferase
LIDSIEIEGGMGVSKRILDLMKRYPWLAQTAVTDLAVEEKRTLAKGIKDFRRGYPHVEPPEAFSEALIRAVENDRPGAHRYMTNAGFLETRKAVAEYASEERGCDIPPEHVVMTYGASGAVNVILKALVDAGDEVIVQAPYLPEYPLYVDNHGALPMVVETGPDFLPDLDAINKAVTPNTRAVLVNSPNNPTGRIYPEPLLRALCVLLQHKERDFKNSIYLISDERLRNIKYAAAAIPDVLKMHPNSVALGSYSKDLAIGGERIGYLIINPRCACKKDLIMACATLIRTLGFVNAPALIQRVVAGLQGVIIDLGAYRRNRDRLCAALEEFGYDLVRPDGSFYIFVKSPTDDEAKFVRALEKEGILVVPGSAYGKSGYFRVAFCVAEAMVENALPGFKRAMEKFSA